MQYIFILCSAFTTTVLLTMGLYHVLFSPRLVMLKRLKINTAVPSDPQQAETEKTKSAGEEFKRFLGLLGTMLGRQANTKAVQQKLLKAHILMRVEEFIGLTVFCSPAVFIVAYLLFKVLWPAVLLSLISLKIPDLYANIKKTGRLNSLTQQLPEALHIISNSLRAGYSFPQAMSVVSKEMAAPIGEELARVIWENRMGKPLEEALHNLGERVESDDLNLVITALQIQNQIGGNLAEILNNISHTLRERIRIKNEIKTLTAQGRLSALIIILLPLAVACFLMIMNPEYMLVLVHETLGLVLLGAAVLLQLVGILIIRKIVAIEV